MRLDNATLTELNNETTAQLGRLHADDTLNTGKVSVDAAAMEELLRIYNTHDEEKTEVSWEKTEGEYCRRCMCVDCLAENRKREE